LVLVPEPPVADKVVAGLLGQKVLASALRCAARWGVGVDQVVLSLGLVSEEVFYSELARILGLDYLTADELAPDTDSLEDDTLEAALATGFVPLAGQSRLTIARAPRGRAIEILAEALRLHPDLRERIRITSPGAIRRGFLRHSPLVAECTDHLQRTSPGLSAREGLARRQERTLLLGLNSATVLLVAFKIGLAFVAGLLFSWIFLAGAWLRLRALQRAGHGLAVDRVAEISDRDLPVYTVLVPLYREGRVVPSLIEALADLDYPAAKLDIKLLIEEDDLETAEAIRACRLPACFEVIALPDIGPKTKPKALNVGLALARGRLLTVYDAEDRPDPDQLRKAAAVFASAPPDLGCVQARLAIDNADECWLAAQFATEYRTLFSRLLPALERLGAPLPLGGTSNHFRVEVLRSAGGWDPHNVTEDADLGVRLARLGWRSAVLDSSTGEEAPVGRGVWMRQRTRWYKGWIQTWLVHMRAPGRLWAELGPRGFCLFQVFVVGILLSPFLHPFTIVSAVALLLGLLDLGMPDSPLLMGLAALHLSACFLGFGAAALLSWNALGDSRLRHLRWLLPTLPLYWLLQSVAAYKALHEFVRHPFRWNKTEHGMSRMRSPASTGQAQLLSRVAALRSR